MLHGPAAPFGLGIDSGALGFQPVAALGAMLRCWMSLFSPRVITYRASRSFMADPAMAVVIQVMIASEKAGVAFTAEPSNGALDRVVVEGAFGQGEVVAAVRGHSRGHHRVGWRHSAPTTPTRPPCRRTSRPSPPSSTPSARPGRTSTGTNFDGALGRLLIVNNLLFAITL